MNDPDADLNLTRGKNSSKTNEVFRSVPEVFPMGTVRNTSVLGAVRDSSEQFGRHPESRTRVSSELFRSVPEVFRSEGGTGLFRSGTRWEQFGHSSEQFVRVLRNLSPRGKAGWDCNRWAEGRLLEIHGRGVVKIKRSFGGGKIDNKRPDDDLDLTSGDKFRKTRTKCSEVCPKCSRRVPVRNTSVPGAVRNSAEQFGRYPRPSSRESRACDVGG